MVSYTSNADLVKKMLMDLETEALKIASKEFRKIIKDEVPVDEGVLKQNVATWVRKDRKTGEVRLQIGIYDRERAKRKGYPYAYHAHLVHFGTAKSQAKPFLRDGVFNNIEKIRELQTSQLAKINNLKDGINSNDLEDEVDDD